MIQIKIIDFYGHSIRFPYLGLCLSAPSSEECQPSLDLAAIRILLKVGARAPPWLAAIENGESTDGRSVCSDLLCGRGRPSVRLHQWLPRRRQHYRHAHRIAGADAYSGGPDRHDIVGAAEFNHGSTIDLSKLGFKALDDHTLQVILKTPTAYFLQVLDHGVAQAVPRHVVESYGETWTEPENIVCCGPYHLHSRTENAMIFRRNQNYHGPFIGNVEQIHLRFSDSIPEDLTLYEAEEIDRVGLGLQALPQSLFQKIMQVYDTEYKTFPSLSTEHLIFNIDRPPFNDPRVRRAFAMATDRRHLAEVNRARNDLPATGGFVPPGIPGHVPDISLPYNIDEARRLLAAAGYPDGRNMPILQAPLLPVCVPMTPEGVYQPWEEQLGVKIEWQVIPWADHFEHIRSEQPHILNLVWGADYPDPDNFLRVGLQEFSSWIHKPYKVLINEARRSMVQKHRLDLFRRAEEILAQEAPILPIYYVNFHYLVKPWVKNFQEKTISRPFWQHVIIEPH